VFISEYFMESCAYALFEAKPISLWAASADVPEWFPFKLTTAALDPYFKGFRDAFGGDFPVDANFTINKVKNFQILRSKQKVRAQVDIDMRFFVNQNGEAIDAGSAVFPALEIDFTVEVANLSVKAILNSVQVEDFHVTSKYLSMDKIVKQDALNFFNEAFNAAVSIINAYFANFYYEVQEDIW